MRAPTRPLRIAIVAASLRILGGQAVQAQRLLDGWQGDPEVDAWLVPINPVPIRAAGSRCSRSNTSAPSSRSCWYWPLLLA